MNKKFTIIAISVSLVLVCAVVITFAALKDYFKKIIVQSVEFVIGENPNYDKENKIIIFDVAQTTSFQLQWKILPEDAENKQVTFTSSNTDIVVDENGLVTFDIPDISSKITIKTVDQEKTDTITIGTKSSEYQEINFNYGNGKIEPSQSKSYILKEDGLTQTMYLFSGTNYKFTAQTGYTMTSEGLTIDNNENVFSENVFSFTPNSIGNTTLEISDGTNTNTINIKIIERIIGINFDEKDENYLIGNKNDYNLPLNVITTNGSTKENVIFKLFDSTNKEITNVVFKENFVVNFGDDLVSGKYTIKAVGEFDENVTGEFTFNLNQGYNVKDHATMVEYFGNDNVKEINLVSNYNILVDDLADEQISIIENEKYLKHYEYNSIYRREKALNFNGNGHTIDAGALPLHEIYNGLGHTMTNLFGIGKPKDVTEYYSPADSTSVPGTSIRELLNTNQVLSDTDKETQRAYVIGLYNTCQKVNINNVRFEGNLGVDAGVMVELNGSENYKGHRTMNCIAVNDCQLTLDNVHIQEFLIGVKQLDIDSKGGSFKTIIKNSVIENVFGYAVYTNLTTTLILEDSKFGDAGHFAVYAKSIHSGKYIDRYTEIKDEDNTLTGVKLIGDVEFDNFIQVSSGDGALTPFINTTKEGLIFQHIPSFLGGVYGDANSLVIKTENGKQYVNFAMQSDCVSTTHEVKVKFDFTETDNYNSKFGQKCAELGNILGKEVYWTALGALQNGLITQTQAYGFVKNYAYATSNIVCCSLNVYQLSKQLMGTGLGLDSLSYFYIGSNVVTE